MATIGKKNFNSPDEIINPGEKIKVEIITIGDTKIPKVTIEPGWRWSEHLKPVLKTDSCQTHHLLYMISGKLASRMNDGTELEFAPGDLAEIPPGHDGWTVGNEPAVWLELSH